jgi:hypothetical protein
MISSRVCPAMIAGGVEAVVKDQSPGLLAKRTLPVLSTAVTFV